MKNKRTIITTPFPTIQKVARNLGVSKRRVAELEEMVSELSVREICQKLRELAENRSSDVRWLVAGHPECPVAVLRKLAKDKNPLVRRTARNSL